jgi:hypothetical protein
MFSKRFISGIFSSAVVALALTACPPPPPVGVSYVATAPPALRSEILVAAPGPGYVWVPGYLASHDARLVHGARAMAMRSGATDLANSWGTS